MARQVAKIHYKPIPGHPDYRVGDDGTVQTRRPPPGAVGKDRSRVHPWRAIETNPIGPGRQLAVRLRDPGHDRGMGASYTQATVHTLVLEAFVGPRPAGMVAHHANDHEHDCQLANLRWDRQVPKGLDDEAIAQLRARAALGEPYASLASAFELTLGEVTRICRRMTRVTA